MRVLLAVDGSAQSRAAVDLAGSLRWPDGTLIRVVAVVERFSGLLSGMSPYVEPEIDSEAVATSLRAVLADVATTLGSAGRAVETRQLEGRPAGIIVEQACDLRADLVIVGSRGFGPLRSMVVGSVSAEVVDRGPCPVLVVRAPSVGSILLAVDGSATAQRALEHLAGAHELEGHPVEVITAGRLAAEGAMETVAAAAAERLLDSGFEARWSIALGDAAHEIIRAADDLGCSLIVMGSRGLTGLDRLRLGSVARNVLLHAHASVLVVREPVREILPGPRESRRRPTSVAV